MHITYAIIYYFLIFVLLLSAALPLFLIKKIRQKFVHLITRYGLTLDNQILYTTLYFTFAVLIAVLLDSGWTFKDLYETTDFKTAYGGVEIGIDDYRQIDGIHKEIYLALYRKHRDYFIAQRNFILACAAFFVWFVFCRILVSITEITENELLLKAEIK